MVEPLFKEYLELTDGKLVWCRGKTVIVEVGPLGPLINELRILLDGKYAGMGLEEAVVIRDMLDRGIAILKQNPYQSNKEV